MSRKRSYQDTLDPESQHRDNSHSSSSNGTVRPTSAPRISKARACAECKRHKIKCEVTPGESSCTKCLRSGLKCVANDFSQRFIDDDGVWKTRAMATIQQLQTAVSHLLRQTDLPELSTFGSAATPENQLVQNVREKEQARTLSASTMDVTRENSQEPSLEDPELVPAPMRSLYEVTKLRNLRSHPVSKPRSMLLEEDFISRGFVSVQEAEELFDYFARIMNQLLWGGIILVHNDLTSVRRGSSLLSAAVLTVAALHIPNKTETLNKCYDEFVSLVSSTSLTRYHTLDDIRALCIGAFWLSDLSWKLSGHAVRIATEMNLHQSFKKMTRGHGDQYERAQLWYLLYVCDHQFSIAYGRPPVIHEDHAIKNYETYLQSTSTVPGDTRLIAQVALFVILTEAYRMFGSDTEQALTEDDFVQLRIYNVAVEQWRLLWQPRSADSPYVRTYPSKGVVLHYHFAKFQLNSLSLRAISPNTAFSMDRKESANIAISSAMSTLSLVLEEPDIRDAIVGVPLFTHTMVTFSAVFLLKVAVNWNSSAYLNVDAYQVQHLVEKVIDLLTRVRAGERHLTHHIASGLSKMLERFKETREGSNDATGAVNGQGGTRDVNQLGELPPDMLYDMVGAYGFGLDEHLLDPNMANFGFLAS